MSLRKLTKVDACGLGFSRNVEVRLEEEGPFELLKVQLIGIYLSYRSGPEGVLK